VVRADLLARLGRSREAAAALDRARALTDNVVEERLIELRAARHEA
jgi:RNA polymerase sigma-70 factor (ECF subfamily)